MLYSNFRIAIEPRQTPEGDFNGAIIGQFQAGSRRFYLEAPRKVGRFIKGNRPDLSISRKLSHPDQSIWRVAKTAKNAQSASVHLVLSSRHPGGLDSGTGRILVPTAQPAQLIASATNGRLTQTCWQVALLEATPGDVFMVVIRAGQWSTFLCYIVGHNQIIEVSRDELPDCYAAQLSQLDHTQRRHTTADLQGGWRDLLDPHSVPVRLF